MKDIEKYGEWVVVTGASSGIGREFAKELAAKGKKIVLVARTEANLQQMLEQDLDASHRIVVADLCTATGLKALTQATKELDVGLVVHSAGLAHAGAFLNGTSKTDTNLQAIHMSASVEIARVFGRRFVNRGSGGLIFVSSGFGFAPIPYAAVYGASKAFVISFGEALAVELRSKNVDVLTVIPGATKTNMAEKLAEQIDMSKVPMPHGDPRAVARAGLAALGHKDSVVPGAMNKVMALMMGLMSRRMAKGQFGKLLKSALIIQPE
ncbi:SDR family NAD(P)-dependent oxidoreductase [uncultured Tateyamaria sp.]|uniref:SDR family NAD(P)-dependent oxidoreductase n=1 Tax=uncultured Tateyamaria sp. TaxID=455651 RepID=UPI0026143F9C|nr:SDR family NAD(P)-dependent oxidoreductase [uncultured Tateyamaria sp.]